MAILIRWTVPDASEIDYDQVYVYRAPSEGETYVEIAAGQAITDNTYFDEDGFTTSWYKIRFYNSTSENYSSYSDPMQGGTYLGYCSLNYVRELNNLTTSDISDTDLYALIGKATTVLNSDINVEIIREKVVYLDNTRKNEINGSNTTYYVQNWKGKFIADRNNDGDVTISDIIIYQVTSDGTETTLTVSSITPNDGKFVLSSTPASGVALYVTYDWAPYSVSDPDEQIKLACSYLATALAFEKINRGLSPQQVFGNVRLTRDMAAGNEFYKKYREIVDRINAGALVEYTEAEVF